MASKVGIAYVNTLEAAQFFKNISGNTQRGAVRIRSLYLSNCFRSIDTHRTQFQFTKFFSKISKFREL
ncbi:hypothetical protein T11_13338 [Trichinella zimbabwensis]|uniref:Uncharacterized protein n=1 Tax=Trichinella zimbabwensis TaxID=268475 RepID=A0A0V1G9V7_9BILA|nr:hypothetical protein T11_13338 [Trichinella zimbabwensis]